jgi:hypothetical protein
MGADQGKLDDNVYESIAKFTELKRDDIRVWQERFTQHCDPGSATMNKEQFCKFYQELRPNENVKRLSENVFRAFDLNSDHGISFSEVCSHFVIDRSANTIRLLLDRKFFTFLVLYHAKKVILDEYHEKLPRNLLRILLNNEPNCSFRLLVYSFLCIICTIL